jgi:hypothetical protein
VAENSWNGREHNHFFRNTGQGRFIEMGTALGLDGIADARGFAASDFDHDGDVDLVVNNYNSPAYYYVNHWKEKGQWLAVRLKGTKSNRDGIGAIITAVTGRHSQHRLVGAGHAYTGQFSKEQIFGLGQAESAEIRVRWPDGREEHFGQQKALQRTVLVEGKGQPIASPPILPEVTAKQSLSRSRLLIWLLPLGILLGLSLVFSPRNIPYHEASRPE